MRLFFSLIVVACGAALLPGSPARAAETEAPFEFAPYLEPNVDETLSGTMWLLSKPDCMIRLQRVGERDRQTYIKRITGSSTDPFASPLDQRPGYITFLVEVENRGESDIVFQPANWWLITDKKEIMNPIGIEDLMANYELMEKKMGPAYELARPAILATTKFVEPGTSVSGLLIYRIFGPKTKRFSVDAVLTSPTGKLVTLRASYQRLKKNRKDKKKRP